MGKQRISKLIATILSVIVILSGCGNNDNLDDCATNEGYEQENEKSGKATGIPKEEIKIGVLYLSDPAEGSGYTYAHDMGILGMQENLGLEDEQILRKINVCDNDEVAIESAINECIDKGCNIIITTSIGYMETTAKLAESYPNVYFSNMAGYMSNGKNFNNYFGRIYQARYVSGLVAGMNTKTDKIGYVAAMDSSNSEVTGGIDAFAMGVYSVNPDATVYVKVTNSWYDPERENAAASELLAMNCDVMAQHCDTVNPQVLSQEKGVYGIGYNSDMSKETPDSCLCSVIWNWSAYYTIAVESIIEGTWDGTDYYGGMSEGIVDVTTPAEFCVEGTQEKVDEAKSYILSGTFNIFNGIIETNDGKTIGSIGKTLDDETITGSINWYYKNVVVVE